MLLLCTLEFSKVNRIKYLGRVRLFLRTLGRKVKRLILIPKFCFVVCLCWSVFFFFCISGFSEYVADGKTDEHVMRMCCVPNEELFDEFSTSHLVTSHNSSRSSRKAVQHLFKKCMYRFFVPKSYRYTHGIFLRK